MSNPAKLIPRKKHFEPNKEDIIAERWIKSPSFPNHHRAEFCLDLLGSPFAFFLHLHLHLQKKSYRMSGPPWRKGI